MAMIDDVEYITINEMTELFKLDRRWFTWRVCCDAAFPAGIRLDQRREKAYSKSEVIEYLRLYKESPGHTKKAYKNLGINKERVIKKKDTQKKLSVQFLSGMTIPQIKRDELKRKFSLAKNTEIYRKRVSVKGVFVPMRESIK